MEKGAYSKKDFTKNTFDRGSPFIYANERERSAAISYPHPYRPTADCCSVSLNIIVTPGRDPGSITSVRLGGSSAATRQSRTSPLLTDRRLLFVAFKANCHPGATAGIQSRFNPHSPLSPRAETRGPLPLPCRGQRDNTKCRRKCRRP